MLLCMGMLSLHHLSQTMPLHPLFAWILLSGVAALTLAFCFLPLQSIVLLLLVAIPLDPDAVVGFLPKLSALDYFSVAAVIAFLVRHAPREILGRTWRSFSPVSAVCWMLFFIYAFSSVIFLDGHVRGVLRWGEFLFYYVLASFAIDENPEDRNSFYVRVAISLSVMAAIVSLITIIQFSHANGSAASAYATFRQRNVMAAFLSLCLPACTIIIPGLAPRWILLRKVASFSALCAFILSYSRGAWIGLTLGIFLVIWGLRQTHKFRLDKIKDAIFVILVLIGPLAVLLIMRNPARPFFSVSGRPLYWQATYRILREHPWMGIGPGNYYARLPNYLDGLGLELWNGEKKHVEFWQHLHSLYFQILAEYGLLGFFLWAIGLGGMLYRSLRTTFKELELFQPFFIISILAYLTHNLVDMLAVNSLDLLFVVLLALSAHVTRTPPQPRV